MNLKHLERRIFNDRLAAHLNLREQFLPYKELIAQVILDKNPGIRTVINKIDNVGEESEYRTFNFELLAGVLDTNVEVHEANCAFRFDYSKVYWNSRLETEHRRLVDKFQPGEAICDVMAGVGPFAVPAGKKRCFVWANDLNPESHASLAEAVEKNKVRLYLINFLIAITYNSPGVGICTDFQRRWTRFYTVCNKIITDKGYPCRHNSQNIVEKEEGSLKKSISSVCDISENIQSLRLEPPCVCYQLSPFILWDICRQF